LPIRREKQNLDVEAAKGAEKKPSKQKVLCSLCVELFGHGYGAWRIFT
jgi:hypothetical protein